MTAYLRKFSRLLPFFALLLFVGLLAAQTNRQIQGMVTAVDCTDLHVQVRTDAGRVWTVVFDDLETCSKIRLNVRVTVKGQFDPNRPQILRSGQIVNFQTTATADTAGMKTVTGTITYSDGVDRSITIFDGAGKSWRLEFDKAEDMQGVRLSARATVLGQIVSNEPAKLIHCKIQHFTAQDSPNPAGPDYVAMGKARHRHDFNVDGKDDIVTFAQPIYGVPEMGSADVCVAVSDGAAFKLCEFVSAQNFSFLPGIPAVGDFNGDGRADIFSFTREKTGEGSYVFRRNEANMEPHKVMFAGPEGIWKDANFIDQHASVGFQFPLLGDFDGDRKTDIAVIVPKTEGVRKAGEVYVLISTGTSYYPEARWATGFCSGDEWPVVGDFDGDGKDDLASFVRSSASGDREGNVAVMLSTGSAFATKTRWHDRFCLLGEIPMAGDFNGDGKDDIVTFCRNEYPNNPGDVYVALSSGRAFGESALWSDLFCVANEIPMTGDFDGDGRTDIASFTHGTKPQSPGEVWVALSDRGTKFGPGRIWIKNFCVGDEIPQTYAALFPYHMFKYSMESDDLGFSTYFTENGYWFSESAYAFRTSLDDLVTQDECLLGARSYLLWDHLAHAEKSDLVFIAGHGSPSSIELNFGEGLDMNLTSLGSWSSHDRVGDLDWIVFHSCSVTSLEDQNGLTWWERWESRPWRRGPFAGLHAALGFKLPHMTNPGRTTFLSYWFTFYLKLGLPVIDAWLEAADDEDIDLYYDNKPSCFYHEFYRPDNLLNSHKKEDLWYNDPRYGLMVIRER